MAIEYYARRNYSKNILTKAPSAELRKDQTDQDSLPPHNILDAILDDLIEQDLSIKEIIAKGFDAATVQKVARLLRLAEYKRRQSLPGPKITSRHPVLSPLPNHQRLPIKTDRKRPIWNPPWNPIKISHHDTKKFAFALPFPNRYVTHW